MTTRCLAVLAGMALSYGAWGDTYLVKSAGDLPSKKTLRWAIEQANDHPGRDKIVFASWLSGKTIAPLTALPQIIDDRTVIDGDINRDGRPDVAISGRKLGPTDHGLHIKRAHWCTVKGLAVIACPQRSIRIDESDYCKVVSCHVGVNLAGTKAVPSNWGSIILYTSDGCTIGGTTPAERNLIAADGPSLPWAIQVRGGAQNTIVGNYIGLSADGMSVLGTNGVGIYVDRFGTDAVNTTIGGTEPGARNLFGGLEHGVILALGSHSGVVCGNWFGLRADGNSNASITGACVRLQSETTGNTVGGTAAGARNVFAGNAAMGVEIWYQHTRDNKIQGNYFGTNASGTAQRRLSEGVVITGEAGAQIIGGNISRAGNYFALNHPVRPTIGVRIATGAGDGTLIRYNTFGVRPDGRDGARMDRGVSIAAAGARVLDNLFARTEQGVAANGTDVSLRIFRNRFRGCDAGVNVAPGARCVLGNLGNTSTSDDGGNLFRPTNTWHVRNEGTSVIKAEGCWFGTTSRSAINAKIWDRRDNPALGKVDFIPLKGSVIPTGNGVAVASVVALATRGAGAEIVFSLSAPADVTVSVLNIAGRRISNVIRDQASEAGTQRVLWSGRTTNGTPAPNGTYLVEVTAKSEDGTQARGLGQVRVNR